ncbi:MAG: elongation factor G, partial [Verrucomicrobiales bacterium]
IPKIFVINACDAENADVEGTIAQIREHFGQKVFPMTLPVNPGPGFNQDLDVMRSEITTYATDQSGGFEESAAEGDLGEKIKALHQQLIELVAESDEGLLERFFEQDGLSEQELRASIHAAVQEQIFTPLFCTAAEKNVGIARLLDFIAKFGSSPVDRASVTAHDASGAELEVELTNPEPVLFIFKTLLEEHIGEVSFFKVYSGKITTGTLLHNTTRGTSEKVGQILLPNGRDRDIVDHLQAGDIGGLVKLKQTHTNDTLSSPRFKVTLPEVQYPAPNVHAALVAAAKGDEEKIAEGLALIHEEDPAFSFRVDSELHQTILSGQGELHLKSVCEALKRRYNAEISLEKPRVPYRETIEGNAESRYRHKKQSGGAGQFAEVWMRIMPANRGDGVSFKHSLVGNNVDRGFVPSVEKGVRAAETEGVLAGYRVVDVSVDFYDGKQHPVDSKDVAFQIAGKNAFKEAFANAHPRLLEPILDVEVRVPEDATGGVMGDLSSRGGKVVGMDTEGAFQVIKAQVPQRAMHAYATDLRS